MIRFPVGRDERTVRKMKAPSEEGFHSDEIRCASDETGLDQEIKDGKPSFIPVSSCKGENAHNQKKDNREGKDGICFSVSFHSMPPAWIIT